MYHHSSRTTRTDRAVWYRIGSVLRMRAHCLVASGEIAELRFPFDIMYIGDTMFEGQEKIDKVPAPGI